MAADASTPALTRIAARRPSLISIIGLALVGLLVFWLVVNFIKAPSYFVEVLFIGLATGCIYALGALRYTPVYGILEPINFTHGDLFMLGGMISVTLAWAFGIKSGMAGLWFLIILVMIIAMICCGILNGTIERIAYRPLRGAPRLAPLITAIGVSFILQDVGLAWKGPNYVSFPDVMPHSNAISIGGVQIGWNKIIVLLITIPLLLLLLLLLPRTRPGKGVRAPA